MALWASRCERVVNEMGPKKMPSRKAKTATIGPLTISAPLLQRESTHAKRNGMSDVLGQHTFARCSVRCMLVLVGLSRLFAPLTMGQKRVWGVRGVMLSLCLGRLLVLVLPFVFHVVRMGFSAGMLRCG